MKNYIWILLFLQAYNSTWGQEYETFNFDINNIVFVQDSNGVRYGDYENNKIFHSTGYCLSGLDSDSVWSTGFFTSTRIQDFLPGKVGMESDDERNKIYVIKSSDPDFGTSWQEWKTAVELGAFYYDGNNDGEYNPVDLNVNGKWDEDEDMPDLIGDLTTWCVFNDSKPNSLRRLGSTAKGIEVKQTIFASASPNAGDLGNVIFIRYVIENTGAVNNNFDSTYFGFLLDHDILNSYDDLAGCDTTLELGFGYNLAEDPPAIVISPLLTPHTYIKNLTYIDNNGNNFFDKNIDTALDTSIIRRGNLLGKEKIIGAKNTNMVSFVPFYKTTSGLGDPGPDEESLRYYLEGGKFRDGTKIDVSTTYLGNASSLDSSNLPSNKFIYSGDPVSENGWLALYGADFRMLLSYGPFNFSVGEPIEVMAAYIVGKSSDNLSSITEAKRISALVDELYQNNFAELPVGVENKNEILPQEYFLSQNYPNPFNPTTTIRYSIPHIVIANEVKQSNEITSVNSFPRNDGRNVTLKVYDILGREVQILVNKKQKPGNYEVSFDADKFTSGVYFYKITTDDWFDVKKMILMK